ncbi:oxaloacetate decarboxylase [Paraferrimonas sp. SM1919]|uniref:isocitrate lyase/PEP mutase family protein n=1 Tax=Paraferrimonas sp. SM1919 TaxID=2662263 RepID=UPI0013D835D2|nr:isocitrate lyase/PEP mutase family protein [Paraferrimonas sp. SM1919]
MISLKQKLLQPGVIKAPGVYDGMTALLAQQTGFEAGFVSGAGISLARFGSPDLGLVSMSEVATCVSQMRERVELPLIVDIDTGFGNAINTARTVKVLERAGASALQLEDQLMPKRCGHLAGKQVISSEEMVGKIHSALDARQASDTLIIARTDALGVNGFEDAIARGQAYLEAGADMLFIEAPKSLAQIQTIAKLFSNKAPLVHNLVEAVNSPVNDANQLERLNYKIALYPLALLGSAIAAQKRTLTHIYDTGESQCQLLPKENLTEINNTVELSKLLDLMKKYI